ncbi:MAG: hypothetical protein ABR540_06540 [Acidimicrobiales bacterium]
MRRAAEPAPNTIRRAHDVLHRALAQGVRWGWPGVNPASSATPPRVPMPDINPPAPHELARLFALATEADVDLADYAPSCRDRGPAQRAHHAALSRSRP